MHKIHTIVRQVTWYFFFHFFFLFIGCCLSESTKRIHTATTSQNEGEKKKHNHNKNKNNNNKEIVRCFALLVIQPLSVYACEWVWIVCELVMFVICLQRFVCPHFEYIKWIPTQASGLVLFFFIRTLVHHCSNGI